jgi:thioesterase domain-containing protein
MDLPVAAAFESPTIRGMADRVRQGGGMLEPSVLPLMRGSGRTPIYFLCGIHLYQQLARALGEEQPSFGVFIPEEQRFFDADAEESGLTALELARSYADALVAHRPEGPVVLAGVSFGGVIAFETARLLSESGREVSALVIIDAVLHSALTPTRGRWLRNVGRFVQHAVLGPVGRRDRGRPEAALSASELTMARLAQRRHVIYERAMRGFDRLTTTWGGPTILIRAAHSELVGFEVAPDLGWGRRVTSELRVFEAPGDHLGVLVDTNVLVTADILRRELRLTTSRTRAGRRDDRVGA